MRSDNTRPDRDGGFGLRFTLDDLEDARSEHEAAPFDYGGDDRDGRPPGAVIKVVGIGGGGGNAVNRMISAGVHGVEFVVVNTDVQALGTNQAKRRLQIGRDLTRGLGSGAKPDVGREAALENTEPILEALGGADMVFVTAGLGGGTGTGASPVIAGLASELGALVVAVVTKPFSFEGRRRREQAEQGLDELKQVVDTVITIPNDKLLHTVDRNTSMPQAFMLADEVLRQAVQGISDLILTPGDINRDFADVKTVMSGMGMALLGTGVADGESRAVEAAQQAISSPLLEDASIEGARGVIFNITGGEDLGLHEVNEAASIIHDAAHPDATILFGYVSRPEMNGKVKVTVIATGFDGDRGEDRPREREARPRAAAPSTQESASHGEQAPPVVVPPQQVRLEDIPYREDDGSYAHLDRLDRDDYDIPAYLRRMQD
jgi:cell division protein FtsZ